MAPRRPFGLGRLWPMPLLAVLAVGLAALAGAGVMAGCTGQDDPPEVVVYCSADQDVAQPILEEFHKQTGIAVLARYDSEASKTVGLVQRLRAEARSPLADVFWSNEVFHTLALAKEGLLAPVELPGAATWPERYRDAQGRWYGFALRARAIAYSTQRVAAEAAPRRLEELTEVKWKGRVVMAAPQFGTTGGDVASWFVHYGPQKAKAILQGLAANGVRLVGGNSMAVRAVYNGQADVALTDTDDVYAAQRNGWPVAMNYLDQGGEGVLAFPNTVACIRGCPHPRQARRLMEFLLSERVERLLAGGDAHNTPVRPELAGQFPKYAIPKLLEVDYAGVSQALPSAVQAATEILEAK